MRRLRLSIKDHPVVLLNSLTQLIIVSSIIQERLVRIVEGSNILEPGTCICLITSPEGLRNNLNPLSTNRCRLRERVQHGGVVSGLYSTRPHGRPVSSVPPQFSIYYIFKYKGTHSDINQFNQPKQLSDRRSPFCVSSMPLPQNKRVATVPQMQFLPVRAHRLEMLFVTVACMYIIDTLKPYKNMER